MRILLVDDDKPLIEALARSLSEQHYTVDIASDGEEGWDYVSSFAYDLVVLDVMLPKLDGVSLCQRLRSHQYHMPVLLLTARDTSIDKVHGLDAGADDYVSKPFDFEELTARIRALLRRESQVLPVLQWGEIRLDPSTFEVTYQSQPLHLTPKEHGLLELFLRNPTRILSLDVILESLWGFADPPGEDSVRTHIKGLRRKLKAAGAPHDVIGTVYGLGYRLKSLQGAPPQPNDLSTPQSQQNRQTKVHLALAQAWEQSKGVQFDRLAILDKTAIALQNKTVSRDLQQQAQSAAHKLVGSLGSFGFPEGSRLARQLESRLQDGLSLDPDQVLKFRQLVTALHREIESPTQQSSPAQLDPQPLVLIVNEDAAFTQLLVQEADNHRIQTVLASTPLQARDWIQQHRPDVVLLKLPAAETGPSGSTCRSEALSLMAELNHQAPPIPVLVQVEKGDFTDRLDVARRGACVWLQQPVTPTQVMASVTQILQRHRSGSRVMIVDDDPQLLIALQKILAPWEFELTILEDSRQFWPVLEQTAPDLLVLDIEMPHINGIELCQVLRNDPHWQHLPVLFLTAHTDIAIQKQIFAIGADDYINKPVTGEELATRILNRLERVRHWAQGT